MELTSAVKPRTLGQKTMPLVQIAAEILFINIARLIRHPCCKIAKLSNTDYQSIDFLLREVSSVSLTGSDNVSTSSRFARLGLRPSGQPSTLCAFVQSPSSPHTAVLIVFQASSHESLTWVLQYRTLDTDLELPFIVCVAEDVYTGGCRFLAKYSS